MSNLGRTHPWTTSGVGWLWVWRPYEASYLTRPPEVPSGCFQELLSAPLEALLATFRH